MTRETTTSRLAIMPLMPGDVRDFLLENPDFLADNSDLLTVLMPPRKQHGDKVQDFQQYMLLRLQDHYTAIKDEHDDLMQLMQEHLQRQSRFNNAMLALMDTGNFEGLLRYIDAGLALELDHEAAGLVIEAGGVFEEGNLGGLRVVADGFVGEWLGGKDVDLAEQIEPAPGALFAGNAAAVRSRALLRLEIFPGFPPALLALGHREAMYYATGLATEQVECLGAVMERCLCRWIDAAG